MKRFLGAATAILAMGAGKQAARGIHDRLAKLERGGAKDPAAPERRRRAGRA